MSNETRKRRSAATPLCPLTASIAPKRTEVRVPATGYAVLCGWRIQIRDFTRVVRRVYAGGKSPSTRVKSDKPAYTRIMSLRDFFPWVVGVWPRRNHNRWGVWQIKNAKLKIEEKTGGAVRFGTPGNAWERLGTDKFFSSAFARKLPPPLRSYGETSRRDKPRAKLAEKSPWWLEVLPGGYTTGSGSFRTALSIKNAKGKS
jgi:hypothetical protein